MSSTAAKHGPELINFHTLANPHGIRFVEGEQGAPAAPAAPAQGEQQGEQQSPAPSPADLAPKPQAPAQPAPAQQSEQGEGKVEDLPKWAQKIISDARDGEAKARTNAKQQAADEARRGLVQELGKALGIVKDDEPVDPAQLTTDLQAAQAAQRDTAVELALYKAAQTAGADPTKLTDSRSFMASIPEDFDPTNTAAVEQLVKDAVAKNPTLKTARVAGASSADHAGGSGENTSAPNSLHEAINQHYRV